MWFVVLIEVKNDLRIEIVWYDYMVDKSFQVPYIMSFITPVSFNKDLCHRLNLTCLMIRGESLELLRQEEVNKAKCSLKNNDLLSFLSTCTNNTLRF